MQHVDRHATNYHLVSIDLEFILFKVSVICGNHVIMAICETPQLRKFLVSQATKGVVCETRHVTQEVGNTCVADYRSTTMNFK